METRTYHGFPFEFRRKGRELDITLQPDDKAQLNLDWREKAPHHLVAQSVSVDPELRRQNLFTRMMELALEEACKHEALLISGAMRSHVSEVLPQAGREGSRTLLPAKPRGRRQRQPHPLRRRGRAHHPGVRDHVPQGALRRDGVRAKGDRPDARGAARAAPPRPGLALSTMAAQAPALCAGGEPGGT